MFHLGPLVAHRRPVVADAADHPELQGRSVVCQWHVCEGRWQWLLLRIPERATIMAQGWPRGVAGIGRAIAIDAAIQVVGPTPSQARLNSAWQGYNHLILPERVVFMRQRLVPTNMLARMPFLMPCILWRNRPGTRPFCFKYGMILRSYPCPGTCSP